MSLLDHYRKVRKHSDIICEPLKTEDYIPQPIVDVSPPKWHLGHTTWFFETFILKDYYPGYEVFSKDLDFLFNSYYENVGKRVLRDHRGYLTRPTVEEVYNYRKSVDQKMEELLVGDQAEEINELVMLGCNHEQQHQELLWTDIKYILGTQPLVPAYNGANPIPSKEIEAHDWIKIDDGIYPIGYSGDGFCFDNELGVHEVKLEAFQVRNELVSNGEYREFIDDGGYDKVNLWHSEGWTWVNENSPAKPLYWEEKQGEWCQYTMEGIQPLNMLEPVCHVNFYEASAFAEWAGARLPKEEEWEVASDLITWGDRWEWTNSAYLPYPGYKKAEGAIGEYNGKFMINQMVLRGSSVATPQGHSRKTYRNFWHPKYQFQFSGIRLAK